jgi:hypothetical protein
MDYTGFEELIEEFGDGDRSPALKFRTLMGHILQSIFLPGDIKAVYCTQEDIDNDFDGTGLGIGRRSGWAICNGINGTPSIDGKTIIGYGETYPEVGSLTGAKTHALTIAEMPVHNHKTRARNNNSSNGDFHNVSNAFHNAGNTWAITGTTDIRDSGIENEGSGQPHSIMQPSIVLLYIQKK